MKRVSLLILLIIPVMVLAQTKSPYAELYNGAEKIDLSKPGQLLPFVTVKVFNLDGTEIDCDFKDVEVSLGHATNAVLTINMTGGTFDMGIINSTSQPGDRVIFKLRDVRRRDNGRKILVAKEVLVYKIK